MQDRNRSGSRLESKSTRKRFPIWEFNLRKLQRFIALTAEIAGAKTNDRQLAKALNRHEESSY